MWMIYDVHRLSVLLLILHAYNVFNWKSSRAFWLILGTYSKQFFIWKICFQIEVLNKYLFLTSKPIIYLVNLSEKDYIRKKNKWCVTILSDARFK